MLGVFFRFPKKRQTCTKEYFYYEFFFDEYFNFEENYTVLSHAHLSESKEACFLIARVFHTEKGQRGYREKTVHA